MVLDSNSIPYTYLLPFPSYRTPAGTTLISKPAILSSPAKD